MIGGAFCAVFVQPGLSELYHYAVGDCSLS
jgi:hypothetical protein